MLIFPCNSPVDRLSTKKRKVKLPNPDVDSPQCPSLAVQSKRFAANRNGSGEHPKACRDSCEQEAGCKRPLVTLFLASGVQAQVPDGIHPRSSGDEIFPRSALSHLGEKRM